MMPGALGVLGSGFQMMGAADKETALNNSLSQYRRIMEASQAAREQRFQEARNQIQGLSPIHFANQQSLVARIGDMAPAAAANAQSTGEMNGAVTQGRQATAGLGSDYMAVGNAANRATAATAQDHSDHALAGQIAAAAVQRGQQGQGQANQQALGQYGTDSQTLQNRIADIFGNLQDMNAYDDVLNGRRENAAQSSMHSAGRVGDNSMFAGGLMQLAGTWAGGQKGKFAGQQDQNAKNGLPTREMTLADYLR